MEVLYKYSVQFTYLGLKMSRKKRDVGTCATAASPRRTSRNVPSVSARKILRNLLY
jgi:hypothetical protein